MASRKNLPTTAQQIAGGAGGNTAGGWHLSARLR
jgi:hypothetical protein